MERLVLSDGRVDVSGPEAHPFAHRGRVTDDGGVLVGTNQYLASSHDRRVAAVHGQRFQAAVDHRVAAASRRHHGGKHD